MMRVYYNLFESPFGWRLALWFSVIINVNLALLNLLPIPPLDGGRIAISLLPHSLAAGYARLEPYGFMIILVLLASNVLDRLMSPMISLVLRLLQVLAGF